MRCIIKIPFPSFALYSIYPVLEFTPFFKDIYHLIHGLIAVQHDILSYNRHDYTW